MKTAISVPDQLFNEAEDTAKQMGLARSQLYVIALKEFMKNHEKGLITDKLNSIYSADEECFDDEISVEQLRRSTENDTW